MRRIPVAFAAALLLVLVPAAVPAAASTSRQGGTSLRVATFNIQQGADSHGNLDLSRTARTIRRTGADIVGLNEVDKHWGDRSDWQDQPARLADMLQMHVYFAHIYDLAPPEEGKPRREYGVAILSRYPITQTKNHSITRLSSQDEDPEPEPAPGFPEVIVDVDGSPVHVYATHLDFRGDPSVRKAQVAETRDILADDSDHAQQVLMGDFNAEPDAPELEPLFDDLTDMWTAAGNGAGLTFPAKDPQKRIDYITASSNMADRGVRTRVPKTQASDHRPVVAQLNVRPGRADGN